MVIRRLASIASEPGGLLRGGALVVLLLLGLSVPGGAEEGPREWLARILDPASLGVAPPPEATLNRKLSVDTIRYDDDPAKRIAVYTVPLARMPAVVESLRQALHVEPTSAGRDPHGSEISVFALSGDGPFPPEGEGAHGEGLPLAVGRRHGAGTDGVRAAQAIADVSLTAKKKSA